MKIKKKKRKKDEDCIEFKPKNPMGLKLFFPW